MRFVPKALRNLVILSNWPNTKAANTALITEFIPEVCKVPYVRERMKQRAITQVNAHEQ